MAAVSLWRRFQELSEEVQRVGGELVLKPDVLGATARL